MNNQEDRNNHLLFVLKFLGFGSISMQLRRKERRKPLYFYFTSHFYSARILLLCRPQNYNHESPELLHKFINKLHNSQIKHFLSVVSCQLSEKCRVQQIHTWWADSRRETGSSSLPKYTLFRRGGDRCATGGGR